jgi:hypothetical protein
MQARRVKDAREEYELDVAAQAEAEAAAERKSYANLTSGAFMHETFIGGALKKILERAYVGDQPLDPNFNIDEALPNSKIMQYPEELHEYLLESTSQTELEYRLDEAEIIKDYEKQIGYWGLKGLPAIMVGSAIGDPSTYFTGGYAAAGKGVKAMTAVQTLKTAAVATGVDLLSAKAVQEHQSWGDVAGGAAGSMAFTTTALALAGLGKGAKALSTATQDVADEFHVRKAKDTFKKQAIDQGKLRAPKTEAEELWQDKWVDDVFEYHELRNERVRLKAAIPKLNAILDKTGDPNIRAELSLRRKEMNDRILSLDKQLEKRSEPEYVVGGEKTLRSITGTESITTDEAALFKSSQKLARDLRPYIDKFAKSIGGTLLNSSNDVTLALGYRLAEYAPGFGGKYTRGRTAANWRELYDRRFMSKWAGEYKKAEDLWHKDSGINPLNLWAKESTQADFNLAINRELNARRFNPEESIAKKYKTGALTAKDKAVKRAADAMANVRKDLLFQAKDAGVERFMDAGYREFTLSRKWVPSNFYRMAQDPGMGWDGITEMLHKAIRKALDTNLKGAVAGSAEDVPERLSRAWAEAIVARNKSSMKNSLGFTNDLFSVADRGFIEGLLKKVGVDEHGQETFMRALDKTRAENTTGDVIEMDLNVSHNGHDIWELLDPNIQANLIREIKRTAGEISLAKVGIKSDKQFNDLLRSVQNYGLSKGLAKEDIDTDVKYLDATRKLLLGETLERSPDSASAKSLALLRDVTQLGTLNWAGFAQAAESGKIAARLGIKAMLETLPLMKTLRRDMQTGKMKNTWLADFEEATETWIGVDHINNNPQYRIDANNFGLQESWDSQSMQKFSGLIRRMKHVQGFINGMNWIKKQQDVIYTQGIIKKIADQVEARMTGTLKEGELRRMADIGIDEQMIPRIHKQMQAQDWKARKSLGMANWDDQEAADTITLAVQRAWMQDIQRSAVGEQYLWTQRSLGKVFAQFRTFTLGAIEKQTMHSLKMRDVESMMQLTWGMLFGTTAYLAKTFVKAAGREDSQEYLKDRLNLQAITAGGAALVGSTSIIPDLSHMVGNLTGQPEWDPFRYSMQMGTGVTRRSSGISFASLAPSTGYLDRLYRVATNSIRSAVDPEFNMSRRDFEDMIKLFPMGDSVFLGVMYNQLLKQAPESNHEDF